MLDYNPAATDALVRLMLGALVPGARADCSTRGCATSIPCASGPACRRMWPRSCPALGDDRTVVTLVNVNPTTARTVVVQAGAYAEHQIESVAVNGRTVPVGAPDVTVQLAPGAGATLTLGDAPLRQHADRRLPLGSLSLTGRAPRDQAPARKNSDAVR